MTEGNSLEMNFNSKAEVLEGEGSKTKVKRETTGN
jgi:hypothetical protein